MSTSFPFALPLSWALSVLLVSTYAGGVLWKIQRTTVVLPAGFANVALIHWIYAL